MTKIKIILILLLIMSINISNACTIFTAKDKNGNVWTGNNADKVFTLNTYITVVAPKEKEYGFFYYTNSKNIKEFPQGGTNEAGLYFDGNSIPKCNYKNFDKKKDYPTGDNEMMLDILRKCKTVQEAFNYFKIYRIRGLEVSQLQFVDKFGNKGIIVADSMWLSEADYQSSTNYNLCHPNKDSIDCWRFPIAERMLKSREIGLESFRDICDSTRQKKWTNTSQIQNLNTGEIWLYYAMNFSRPYKTSIKELINKGNHSFYFYELFKDDLIVKQLLESKEVENNFFLVVLSLVFVIVCLIIYVITIKIKFKKQRILNIKENNYR